MKERHENGPPPNEHQNRRGEIYRLKNGEPCTPLEWASEQIALQVLKVEKIGGSKWQWYFTVTHADSSEREMDPIPGDRILEPTYMRKKFFQGSDLPITRLKPTNGTTWPQPSPTQRSSESMATTTGRRGSNEYAATQPSTGPRPLLILPTPTPRRRRSRKAKSGSGTPTGDCGSSKSRSPRYLRDQHLYVEGGDIGTGLTLAGIEPKKLSVRRRDGDLKGKVLMVQYLPHAEGVQ